MFFDLQLNYNPPYDLVRDTVFSCVCFKAVSLSKWTWNSWNLSLSDMENKALEVVLIEFQPNKRLMCWHMIAYIHHRPTLFFHWRTSIYSALTCVFVSTSSWAKCLCLACLGLQYHVPFMLHYGVKIDGYLVMYICFSVVLNSTILVLLEKL